MNGQLTIVESQPLGVPKGQSTECTFSIRRLTVSEYEWMTDVGILSENDRVELIDGVLVQMPAQKSRHSAVTSQIAAAFYSIVLAREAWLRVQTPIILTDDTEPEPDLALVKYREDAYANAHPTPSDVLLLIEVSDTSLEMDQGIKLSRYAASGIPEVWIVNLIDNRVEVYREPASPANEPATYRSDSHFVAGEMLTVQAFPSLNVAVDDVLVGA